MLSLNLPLQNLVTIASVTIAPVVVVIAVYHVITVALVVVLDVV
jgi:hypothetical protein